MNDNFTNSDLLIQYLDGELEGEDLIAIQAKVDADKELATELENLRLTKAAVKSYGLKKKIGTIHSEMMKEMSATATSPIIGIKRILQYSTRVAAVFIIVLGVTVLYQYYSATPEKLFRNNYDPFNLHETRGAGSPSTLENPYKNGQPEIVMNIFKKITSPQPEDYFLNGNAALQLNKTSDAIQSFLALQEKNKITGTNAFEDDTEYYLALSYLNNHEPAKALPIFEKIHADESHPYHTKVSALFLWKLRHVEKEK
jgi:tetratricopeptide (TPR) repeat protein